jgi:hypothetical protein
MKTKYILLCVILAGTLRLQAQTIGVRQVNSKSDWPSIVWQTVKPVDTMDFRIFRSYIKDKNFKEIHTIHYIKPSGTGDSLFLNMVDTTLTKKGVYLYYVEILREGKKVISATAIAHNLGILPEPQIIAFKAEPLSGRKAVTLHWKLNYTETVGSLTLYRSNKYEDGYKKIAELDPGSGSYTDVVPRANEPWFYFLELNNYFGGKTRSVRTPAFATFKEKPFPPQDLSMEPEGDSIVFTWRNVGDNIVGYHVYRSIGERPFELIDDMQPATTENIRFVDKDPEIKKAFKLRYFIRNVSDGFVESNITDTLEVYFPEHRPVYPPAQLDYVTTTGGYTKLLWVPDERGFVTGYNVYVVDTKGDTAMLNNVIIATNHYTDSRRLPPGKYVYQIEGVGLNDKRSEKRAQIAVQIIPERIEVLLDVQKTDHGIKVSWRKPVNGQVKSLILYRKTGKNKPVLIKTFSASQDGSYEDRKLVHGKTYMYEMTAVMDNGSKIPLDNGVEMRY